MVCCRRRVVVTGLGVVSPLGVDIDANTRALASGTSGIGVVSTFDAAGFPSSVAGCIPEWPERQRSTSARMQSFLDRAVCDAITSAGMAAPLRGLGVSLGTGRSVETSRPGPPDDGAAGQCDEAWRVADLVGAGGPVLGCYTACCTGSDALGLGYRSIRRGAATAMLCGSADAQVCEATFVEFALLNALAEIGSETTHPRPFDRSRCGIVLGEGAAMFMLEDAESACQRGAPILAELAGYASASDAYSLTRGPADAAGAVRAMRGALEDAGMVPGDIDYINAHATGTRIGDALEVSAIKQVFAESPLPPTSSTKSMTGHLLTAAGAVEAAFCVIALQQQMLLPTLNVHSQDPDCDVDCVANRSRRARVRAAMSNGIGFGGVNSVLIFRRWEP